MRVRMRRGIDLAVSSFSDKVNPEGHESDAEARSGVAELVSHLVSIGCFLHSSLLLKNSPVGPRGFAMVNLTLLLLLLV